MKSLKKFKLSNESLKYILGGEGDCKDTQKSSTSKTTPTNPQCTDEETVTYDDCNTWVSTCQKTTCPD